MRDSTSVVSAPGHQCCALATAFHLQATRLPSGCMSSVFVILKFHLKIYGMLPQASKQASRQANIHTHVHNAVPLVWGSLRLTPIIQYIAIQVQYNIEHVIMRNHTQFSCLYW